MSQMVQNLERYYNSFADQEYTLPFFKGIAGYLEYALSIPTLKKAFDEQISERRVLIKQIGEAEEKTREEMKQAKTRLLAIIRKAKIDVNTLERHQTWPLPNGETNILQEMSGYEDQRISGSRFISDEIQRHLFDIAANLLKLGYKEKLKEFIVSHGANEFLIFSQTLPRRHELVECFENERALKLWSDFETLMQFYTAHQLVLSGKAINENGLYAAIPTNSMEDVPWFGGSKEGYIICKMAWEMQQLTKNTLSFSKSVNFPMIRRDVKLEYLNLLTFKTISQRAHYHLLRVASEYKGASEEEISGASTGINGLESTKLRLEDDWLMCGGLKIPMRAGHEKMIGLLMRDARIYYGDNLSKKGSSINREVLQNEGGYKNEDRWRDALNKMRRKIKKCTIPRIKIRSETRNHYIMELKYPKKDKQRRQRSSAK